MKRLLIILFMAGFLTASDQIPGPKQTQPVLIKNGTLHTVSNGVMSGWDLLFENGKITRIEDEIIAKPEMKVIDVSGKHVYPGLISSATVLGMIEIRAVRATNDLNESGTLNPNVKTNVSYNPDSELIPVARSNGVLLANVIPTAGLVTGQSSVMKLDGWTWEDATLEAPTGLHIKWPNMTLGTSDPDAITKERKSRAENIQIINDLLEQVRAYANLKEPRKKDMDLKQGHDLKLESMIPYIKKEKPVIVHASEVRQIEAAVHWAAEQDLKLVIIGGDDAWRVTDLLKNYNVPVIYENVLSMPYRRYENYDQAFKTPLALYEAGINFAIVTLVSTMEAPHLRNLPYEAAMAAAYGLPEDVALRSITLSAAEILGVSNRVGSLETGKDATLFISDGNILDIRSHVLEAWIDGRTVDLDNRHKMLYRKYQEKYRQLGRIE